jgi:glycosyltransferase involved in cell wall biosynthesis
MERRATRGRAAVVAVSRKAADEVRALYGVRASVRVIENGGKPDPRPLPPKREARHELGLADVARVALFIGRAESTKGFDEVVALAKARPEVTLLAAGVAPQAGLPANLLAQGVVGADVMVRLLAASDVVVLPSRYEGCSFALIDAVAGDRPIVTTATGCFDVVGEHPFGMVVPLTPGAPVAPDFIEAVDSVLAAPQRFKPLAACKERFSFVRFAREWRALIREISTHVP